MPGKFETIAVTFTEYSFNEKFTPFKINFSLVKEITSDSSDVTENVSFPQSISEEDGQTLKKIAISSENKSEL